MVIVRYSLYFLFLFLFLSCGKVVQDISSQTQNSVFKSATFIIPLSDFSDASFYDIFSTKNVVSHYGYLTGISFDKGQEKVGWVEANTTIESVTPSKNSFQTINYDSKKNTVTSARYQQGLISISQSNINDIKINTYFKKIRPKYDLFAFSYYLSKDDFIFYVLPEIPTKDIIVSRYDHLVSSVFLQHIQQESYNEDSIIPFKDFQSIIPKSFVTPSLNVYSKNTTRFFKIDQPLFQIKSPLSDFLLSLVTLSYHSDEVDVKEYINSKEMKQVLTDSVTSYFQSKPMVTTASVEVSQ